jgi:hypothetical protein
MILLLTFGCGPQYKFIQKSQPDPGLISNQFFDIALKPISGYMCFHAFELSIRNKTDSNIELDWNKTLFIVDDQTNGTFMFEGVAYKDRSLPKPPNIIFSKTTFQKTIIPSNLTYFGSSGWSFHDMKTGKYGIYLTIITNQGIKNEKIILDFQCISEKIERIKK